MNDMVNEAEGAQFIMATHSPIILGFPGAQIFSFDEETIVETRYEDLQHVQLYRRFLDDPGSYLEMLLAE